MLERFRGLKKQALNYLLAGALSGSLLVGCTETKPQDRATFGFYGNEGQFNLNLAPRTFSPTEIYGRRFNSRQTIVEITIKGENQKVTIFKVSLHNKDQQTDNIRFGISNFDTIQPKRLSMYWNEEGLITKTTVGDEERPFSRIPLAPNLLTP